MADYYTNFSVVVLLPDEAAGKEAVRIASAANDACYSGTTPEEVPEELRDAIDHWGFETEPEDNPPAVWIHSEEGGIDGACAFIQFLLQRHQLKDKVTFEWSHDCSKPRTDAYGGGAAIITADSIKTYTTGQWLHEQQTDPPEITVHRLELRFTADRTLDENGVEQTRQAIERINQTINPMGMDLIAHPDEIEIQEHESLH